jgi:ABC-type microcin C transport system permease subunit YejB
MAARVEGDAANVTSPLGQVTMIMILLSFVASTVVAILAYAQARTFVVRRLRYVDAVQTALAPIVAGIGAALIAIPFTALPLIGVGTALSFGFAVGAGVAAGAKEVRRSLPRF